ncbi:hypothetical protein ACRAWG_29645 [Methylobacterium sp. P31]
MGEVGALISRQGGIGEARQDRATLSGKQVQNFLGEFGVAAGLRIERNAVNGLHARTPGIRIRRGLRI